MNIVCMCACSYCQRYYYYTCHTSYIASPTAFTRRALVLSEDVSLPYFTLIFICDAFSVTHKHYLFIKMKIV